MMSVYGMALGETCDVKNYYKLHTGTWMDEDRRVKIKRNDTICVMGPLLNLLRYITWQACRQKNR